MYFYQNPRLMWLAIALILVAGLSSFFVLPRMEDPQLVERAAIVHTLFPGAEPERVESLISEKIEDALNEVEEIKEVRSTSRESISTIAIELRDEVMESEKVWTKIRDRLKDVSKTFPAGAGSPEFREMDIKAYALLVGLRWDQDDSVNFAVLNRLAKQLEDRLLGISGTEKTRIFGQPREEVLVSIDSARMTSLNLSVADVASQIRGGDSKIAAGLLRSDDSKLLMEVSGELDSVARIESIPIRYSGQQGFVRLGDVATVEKTIADPPASLAIVDGRAGVVVGAFVRGTARIDVWAEQTKVVLDDFETNLPRGIALDRIFDQSVYVNHRLTTLLNNLLMGAAAVFFVIFFMMGFRSAVVVSLALPLASMMVLFGMRVMEIPVHQMSVTGLIIALGLLIDNAIVIVEETSIKLRSGLSGAAAVSESVKHLALPLFGSTLTTALAFAPIALMPGPAGEFVGAIAINVIIAIFSSLFLALTIIPAIAVSLDSWFSRRAIRDGKSFETTSEQGRQHRHWWQHGFSNSRMALIYRGFLDFVYARPLLGVGGSIVLPLLGFVVATQLPEQFFPAGDRNQVNIELELSPQSSLAQTITTTAAIRSELLDDPDVERVDWFVGQSAPGFYYNLIPRRSEVSQYAQAMVQLKSSDNVPTTIQRLQAKLDLAFAHSRVLVRQLEQGPPFDAPVEVRLFGPDLEQLQRTGEVLRSMMVQVPGVLHTRSEIDEVLPGLAIDVNEENARAAGLSLTDVAMQLDAATEGVIGGSVLEATEELPVRVRLRNNYRVSLDQIASLDLVNRFTEPGGAAGEVSTAGSSANQTAMQATEIAYRGVPLSALAEFRLTSGFGSITHLAGRRMNEIQVYIPAGMLPSKVLTEFQNRLAESDFVLPVGYHLTYGGEAAKRDEAVGNLMASVGILMVLMIATLVLSFGSFRVASIVGIVGGLSVGLGLGALWVFGFSFGFMAIIGAMGLMGVAINDTIVVLAAIGSDAKAATGDREAIRDVVFQSTRHIVSTSLTTMAGFAPLIIGGGGFWPPLAVAIAGGVGGATILALICAPSCYLIVMRWRKDHHRG